METWMLQLWRWEEKPKVSLFNFLLFAVSHVRVRTQKRRSYNYRQVIKYWYWTPLWFLWMRERNNLPFVLLMCILWNILDWCSTLYKENNWTGDTFPGKRHSHLLWRQSICLHAQLSWIMIIAQLGHLVGLLSLSQCTSTKGELIYCPTLVQ